MSSSAPAISLIRLIPVGLVLLACGAEGEPSSPAVTPTATRPDPAPPPPVESHPVDAGAPEAPRDPRRVLVEELRAKTWRSKAISGGGETLVLSLEFLTDEEAQVTVRWQRYEKMTARAKVPVLGACDKPRIAKHRHRVSDPCLSIETRLNDLHPTYGYVSKTRMWCVIGRGPVGSDPVVWCKLQYTDWTELR